VTSGSGIAKQELGRLSGRGDVRDVVVFLRRALRDGYEAAELDVRDITSVYPNGAVPIAAIVNQFRAQGISVRFTHVSLGSYFDHSRVRNPLLATQENLREPGSRLDIVWAYTQDTAVDLTNAVIEELAQRIVFGEGVLPALNWCLFEILDNVFQHSESETGFFMAQLHKVNQRLLLCVADSGIGVHRSFYKGGKYRPPTPFDALTLAVRQGVSSTGDKRGNGLYGLKGVIEHNGGKLDIVSGRGLLQISPSGIDGRNSGADFIIDADHHCTVLDFSLDVSKPVDLGEVLGAPEPDMRLESIESDDGRYVVPIIDHAQGTGTRPAAERLRNYLVNYLNEGAPSLILDFAGVPMVSSSFADETIGKLAEEFGVVGFSQRFRLVNMNPNVQMLLDRAIALRIAPVYHRDDALPKNTSA
jgi:anti-anti-sigma regulatory factor/anti-sigma regulatory factor (Ser/Thr protein kinase)